MFVSPKYSRAYLLSEDEEAPATWLFGVSLKIWDTNNHILLNCTTLSSSAFKIDIMRKSGKGQQMSLWNSRKKNDYHFSMIASAKPQ